MPDWTMETHEQQKLKDATIRALQEIIGLINRGDMSVKAVDIDIDSLKTDGTKGGAVFSLPTGARKIKINLLVTPVDASEF